MGNQRERECFCKMEIKITLHCPDCQSAKIKKKREKVVPQAE